MNIEVLAHGLLILSFVIAGIGTVLPGVPGSMLIAICILAHKWLLPDFFGWWTVGIVIGLGIASWIVDFLSGIWGAKLGGATKAGIIGAAVGGFFGIFFGLPGLILGPFCGAIVGDLIAKRRDIQQLFKSGLGAAFGFIISLVMRFVLLIAQALVVTLALIF